MVLNDSSEKWRISEETRDRVIEVAERLGYRKNLIARSMVTGKTDVIGIAGTLDGSFGAEILRGVSEVAEEGGYSIKFFHGDTAKALADTAKKCAGQRLSGVICHSNEFSEPMRLELAAAGIPMVHVDNIGPEELFSSVCSDDFDGAKQAVAHLYDLGHRRIAHITGNLDHVYAKVRYEGFLAGLKERGLTFDETLAGFADGETALTDNFRKMLFNLLKKGRPTAIFCSGDPTAMKVLKAAVESGLKVPDDLSIAGFAGLEYTQWAVPALTTVRQPFVEMGRAAAEILISEIRGETPFRAVKLPVELIIRQSTAKPKNNIRRLRQ
jgi:LacI family transcriptional regulator